MCKKKKKEEKKPMANLLAYVLFFSIMLHLFVKTHLKKKRETWNCMKGGGLKITLFDLDPS